jgi:hypothetical protein
MSLRQGVERMRKKKGELHSDLREARDIFRPGILPRLILRIRRRKQSMTKRLGF